MDARVESVNVKALLSSRGGGRVEEYKFLTVVDARESVWKRNLKKYEVADVGGREGGLP